MKLSSMKVKSQNINRNYQIIDRLFDEKVPPDEDEAKIHLKREKGPKSNTLSAKMNFYHFFHAMKENQNQGWFA